ncbi:MAG: D-lactate dehydrogenase [Fusobacteriaceae bacterium]|jgi:D-lactate dehydrogenase|nr:D-lactate dehydrogenase [Fusobacteriaceae bacterium]
MKVAFFDTKKYDRKYFDKFNKNHKIKYFETKLNVDSVALAKGYDAVCVFVNDEVNKEVLEKLKEYNIKLVALRCAGYNNVDLKTAKELGIKVVRVPAYSPYAVAEHTVALILTLNRKIHKSYLRTREANFTLSGLTGFDLNGKTAGIIGTGKIALIVIKILKGFGMKVLAYDPYPNYEKSKELDFEYTTLENLYKNSDIISLHCPLTKDTKYIINKESIDIMKDGVMIVNTGRGALINTQDLINGLKSQKIGYAALDVYEEEGDYFFEDYSDTIISDDILARLLSFNNVLVTSHQAFLTEEALSNIAETTLKNLFEFENKLSLTNEVVL